MTVSGGNYFTLNSLKKSLVNEVGCQLSFQEAVIDIPVSLAEREPDHPAPATNEDFETV